jgi:hypothetical protein
MQTDSLIKPSFNTRAPGGTTAFNLAYPIVTASTVALSSYDDTDPPLADGTYAIVISSGVDTKVYSLDTFDVRPADGTTILTTFSGTGRWVEITAATPAQLFTEIIWDPSVVASSGNIYKTWAEVQAAVNAVNGAAEVQINSSPLALATIPNTAVLDGKHMTRFLGARYSGGGRSLLDIQDGAVLTNIAVLQDLNITPTLPAANLAPFVLGGYMRIENCFIKPLEGSAGTNGILQLAGSEGVSATLFVDQESTIDGTRVSPAIVAANGTLTVVGTRDSTISTQGVSRQGVASVAYLFDASVAMPFSSSPGFSYRLLDLAQGVAYNDFVLSPQIVQTPGVAGPTAQQAIDALKPFQLAIVDGDLTPAGTIQITHNLGLLYVFIDVIDDADDLVIPVNVHFDSTTQLTLDLSAFRTGSPVPALPGTWHAIIRI